jgi:hypothetical protein
MTTKKEFDWTKLTKGRGDGGNTSTLFGHTIPKTHENLVVLNCAERAHVALGNVKLQLLLAEDRLYPKGYHGIWDLPVQQLRSLVDLLDPWFIELGGLLSCMDAKEMAQLKKCAQITPGKEGELLQKLDRKLQACGEYANRAGIPGDWMLYGSLKHDLSREADYRQMRRINLYFASVGSSLFQFTTDVRELEQKTWAVTSGTNPTYTYLIAVLQVLNRLSKLTYLLGRVFSYPCQNAN